MKVLVLGSGQGPGQGAGYFMSRNCWNGWRELGLEVVGLGLEDPRELGWIRETVESEKPSFVFQLLAQQYGHIPDLLEVAKSVPVILWSMTEEEDHANNLTFSNKIALYCTYTSQEPYFSNHVKNGANTMFLPTAADGSIFHRLKDVPEYAKRDVVYIGYPFDEKRKTLEELKHSLGCDCFFQLSTDIPQEQENEYYNGSKIMVEIGQHQDWLPGSKRLGGCPVRIYEVGAAGGFQIVNNRPDLPAVYLPREEIATYDGTVDDLVAKINYYLEHEEERKNIAEEGHQRTIFNHLYIHRFQQILWRLKERGVLR